MLTCMECRTIISDCNGATNKLYQCLECTSIVCVQCESMDKHLYHCMLRLPSHKLYDKMKDVFSSLRETITTKLALDEVEIYTEPNSIKEEIDPIGEQNTFISSYCESLITIETWDQQVEMLKPLSSLPTGNIVGPYDTSHPSVDGTKTPKDHNDKDHKKRLYLKRKKNDMALKQKFRSDVFSKKLVLQRLSAAIPECGVKLQSIEMDSLSSSNSDDSDLEALAQLSDWDESEATELNLAKTPPRKPPKRIQRVNFFITLNEAEFTLRFRLNKSSVEMLLKEIYPYITVTSKRNNGLAPIHQLLLTLRFFAIGRVLMNAGDFLGVSLASASRTVTDISAAIAKLYKKYVTLHNRSARQFQSLSRFPRVAGVIDCMHVKMQPSNVPVGDEYRNRHGHLSLSVQVVCEADMRLMNVVARWPGSFSNAAVFDNSELKNKCESGALGSCWLLGSRAYPNRPYLLTPVMSPYTDQERRYNEAHIRTTSVMERTIESWKRRFPIVASRMRLNLWTIQAVIIATAVLHNICKKNYIAELPPEVELPIEDYPQEPEGLYHFDNDDQRQQLICNYF